MWKNCGVVTADYVVCFECQRWSGNMKRVHCVFIYGKKSKADIFSKQMFSNLKFQEICSQFLPKNLWITKKQPFSKKFYKLYCHNSDKVTIFKQSADIDYRAFKPLFTSITCSKISIWLAYRAQWANQSIWREIWIIYWIWQVAFESCKDIQT